MLVTRYTRCGLLYIQSFVTRYIHSVENIEKVYHKTAQLHYYEILAYIETWRIGKHCYYMIQNRTVSHNIGKHDILQNSTV